jgi:hypothetical protein
LAQNASSRAAIKQSVSVAQSAQQLGIDAYNDGRYTDAATRTEINRGWFLQLIPDRDPEGRSISQARREALARQLSLAPNDVLRQCPAIAAESIMSDIRAKAGGRKARPQDAFDYLHAIPALAYCDAFVTNDGPLRAQAHEASTKMRRSIATTATLADAADLLHAPCARS